MVPYYICLRCRHRILQKARYTRGIGFVSLNQPILQGDAEPLQHEIPKPRSRNGIRARPGTVERPIIRHVDSSSGKDSVLEDLFSSNQPTQPARTHTRYSGLPIHQVKPQHTSSTQHDQPHPIEPPRDQLYHDKIPLQDVWKVKPRHTSSTQHDQPHPIEPPRDQLYHDKIPLQDVWKEYQRLLFSQGGESELTARNAGNAGPRTPKLLYDFLIIISRHFVRSNGNDRLPSPHEVIDTYHANGLKRYPWDDVLWIHLAEIIKLLHASDGAQTEGKSSSSNRQVTRIMMEVVLIGSAFRLLYAESESTHRRGSHPWTTKAWFNWLFPRYYNKAPLKTMTACKLTHQCLKDLIGSRKFTMPVTPDSESYINLLNDFVGGRLFPMRPAKDALAREGVPQHLIDHWIRFSAGWGAKPTVYESEKIVMPSLVEPQPAQSPIDRPKAPHIADHAISSLEQHEQNIATSIERIESSFKAIEDSVSQSGDEVIWGKASIYRRATTIIKDVERAVERYDVARAASIWQKYETTLAILDLEPKTREEIYIHFLSGFFALSRQEQAVHVWNHMLKLGITPNQRHWNAMLSGCSKAQDVASLEEVWNNMLSTGIEPDQVSWATYIHGLIMCKKWQRGLQALNDLGTKWKQANKNQGTKTTLQAKPAMEAHSTLPEHDPNSPSLAPVQSALTALLRIGRDEQCPLLLDWAKAHSIPLTTEFFNILLRPAVRSGDTNGVNHIFTLMTNNNCSADEHTYTILLNAHMSNANSTFSTLSPEEQQSSILGLLDDMTAKGVPIDTRIYSTILYGLLNPKYDETARNDHAARAVLDHMDKSGIRPTTHIYSILVSHYFSLSPPDLQAVESLWKRIKSDRPCVPLDREFYEKMVQGYARTKSIERMMFFLRRIPQEGKCPTLECLKTVLDCLIECGEWEMARELVRDVRDQRNGLRRFADPGHGNKRWEEEFWAKAERWLK
ncbi:MAG: hypothetical protein Q9166_004785 [cf. Caloplaca sp. 2 TL-2023]